MKAHALRACLAAIVIGLACGAAAARDLKLVKVGQPDATGIKPLVASLTAGCKTDQEKAVALWGYLTRNPFYHWYAREEPESTGELGYVLDPIIRANVYGSTICFQVQHSLAALCEQAGLKTRQRDVWGHCVLEVFYDNAWHLFDAQYDCASYFRGDDGQTILDLATIRTNANKYVVNQANPSVPFFQWNNFGSPIPWEDKQYCADNFYNPTGTKPVYATLRAWGHTMHNDLRRGERLVRTWGKEGKWYCPASHYEPTHPFVDMNKGPYDIRNPKNHYVNGTLIYQPDWRNENNFLDGLYEGVNYTLADGKVRPAGTGECHVTFRVHSPYLIVGKPGKLNVNGDSHSGAILEADFHRADLSATNAISVSIDNGLTWQVVWTHDATGDAHVKLDLTDKVEGHYEYLVKIRLDAETPADASVANLSLRTSLFMSPVPLPAIRAGVNRFAFSHKAAEAVYWMRADMGDSSGYSRFFHELNNLTYSTSYSTHLSPTSGRAAYAVVKVAPPPGWKVHWATAVGSYGSRGTSDVARIAYRTDADPKWVYAWKGGFEGGVHWREERSADFHLKTPADACYVRYSLYKVSSHTSLNTYRIYAHCRRPEPPLGAGQVKITHNWFADGQPVSQTVLPDLEGQTYAIKAAGTTIVNRSIIMEVLNDPPTGLGQAAVLASRPAASGSPAAEPAKTTTGGNAADAKPSTGTKPRDASPTESGGAGSPARFRSRLASAPATPAQRADALRRKQAEFNARCAELQRTIDMLYRFCGLRAPRWVVDLPPPPKAKK